MNSRRRSNLINDLLGRSIDHDVAAALCGGNIDIEGKGDPSLLNPNPNIQRNVVSLEPKIMPHTIISHECSLVAAMGERLPPYTDVQQRYARLRDEPIVTASNSIEESLLRHPSLPPNGPNVHDKTTPGTFVSSSNSGITYDEESFEQYSEPNGDVLSRVVADAVLTKKYNIKVEPKESTAFSHAVKERNFDVVVEIPNDPVIERELQLTNEKLEEANLAVNHAKENEKTSQKEILALQSNIESLTEQLRKTTEARDTAIHKKQTIREKLDNGEKAAKLQSDIYNLTEKLNEATKARDTVIHNKQAMLEKFETVRTDLGKLRIKAGENNKETE